MRFKRIIPIVKVSDIERAASFYCDQLGFEQVSLFQRAQGHPGYLSLQKDGCWLHVSSFPGDGSAASCVYVDVEDIEELRADLLQRGWKAEDVEIMNQDWGNREIYVSDDDGNVLRFGTR